MYKERKYFFPCKYSRNKSTNFYPKKNANTHELFLLSQGVVQIRRNITGEGTPPQIRPFMHAARKIFGLRVVPAELIRKLSFRPGLEIFIKHAFYIRMYSSILIYFVHKDYKKITFILVFKEDCNWLNQVHWIS